MLVVDEVYRGIAVGGAVQPPAASLAPNAVTVGGLSKVCGLAGLRIGWAAGPPLLVDDVRGHHAAASRCPAAACEALALVALEHLDALLRRTCDLVHDNLQHLAALIDRHPACRLDVPDGGSLAFPAIPVDDVDAWCTRLALEYGLLVAPGPACFGIPGRVRLNLAAERGYWRAALPLLDVGARDGRGRCARGERCARRSAAARSCPARCGSAAPRRAARRGRADRHQHEVGGAGDDVLDVGADAADHVARRRPRGGAASTRTRAPAGASASPSSTSTITLAPTPSTSARGSRARTSSSSISAASTRPDGGGSSASSGSRRVPRGSSGSSARADPRPRLARLDDRDGAARAGVR